MDDRLEFRRNDAADRLALPQARLGADALRGEVDVSKREIPKEIRVAMVVWRCYSRHDFFWFWLTCRVHALITITLRFPMG